MIRLIYATTTNRVIGRNGKLVAVLPEDLKRFAILTTGAVVLYGLNTYWSLPGRSRPLPKRTNIVLSGDTSLHLQGCHVYNSLDKALEDYKDQDIWIIGGGKVLRQAILIADEIRLTLIHQPLAGDVLSPVISPEEWIISSEGPILTSGTLKYQYVDYKRILK